MDNLKAGAYDAIAPKLAELEEQNKNLRAAINLVLDEVQNTKASEIIDNPVNVLIKISEHCLNALRNNKPI